MRQLTEVAFVPSWTWQTEGQADDSGKGAGSSSPEALRGPFRRSAELLSWTNAPLLTALAGAHQPRYFAPPALRSPDMLVMMSDLGMSAALGKDVFLRVALDIQAAAGAEAGGGGGSGGDGSGGGGAGGGGAGPGQSPLQEARQRGRAILRYVRDMDLGVGLFQDKDAARVLAVREASLPAFPLLSLPSSGPLTNFLAWLCFDPPLSPSLSPFSPFITLITLITQFSRQDINFVPLMLPTAVSPGAHVTYTAAVGRFSQCASRQGGALVFSLVPVLDDDICPHQIFHSALGEERCVQYLCDGASSHSKHPTLISYYSSHIYTCICIYVYTHTLYIYSRFREPRMP